MEGLVLEHESKVSGDRMKKIPFSRYNEYIAWAEQTSANQVYPLSIAEGIQTGDIYTDGIHPVNAVLFWHYCGFAYLSGNPGIEFLREIYEEFYLKKQNRRFLLITGDPETAGYYSAKSGIKIGHRIEYRFEKKDVSIPNFRPNLRTDPGYRIERIDKDLLSRIHGRIIPSFSWQSEEQFLEKGMGYVVMEGNEIAAAAFSAAVSSSETDIGVETGEAFRNKGYAGKLTEKMCREICLQGKRPVWAHAQQNQASGKTALHCGFTEYKRNFMILRDM